MRLRAIVLMCTLHSLKCMGEQVFLSQPDIQLTEISETANSDISNIADQRLLSQPRDEQAELLEISGDDNPHHEEDPILLEEFNKNYNRRKRMDPPINTLYDKKSMSNYLVYNGLVGDWEYTQYTEGDQAACGILEFWQKAQDQYDGWQTVEDNDDSAVIGFILISCGWNDWNDQRYIYVGNTKDTSQKIPIMCKSGTYMYGMTVQVASFVGDGYDDTAINGLNILCSDKLGYSKHENWYSGWWGRWRYIYDYDPLMKVVGASVKLDTYYDVDNQGLTGLELVRAKFY